MTNELLCGFCGKSREEVEHLIAGPTTYICNECVKICIEIVQFHDSPFRSSELKNPSINVDLAGSCITQPVLDIIGRMLRDSVQGGYLPVIDIYLLNVGRTDIPYLVIKDESGNS